jgi:DNA (cytosine-5)-methyltransferase 1
MGWEAAFFSEIEKFPCAVLQHHYPDVPLHGDFTTIEKNQYGKIDLLVGGTPCQSFSVAGLRGGLDDDRGNLALEFCRLAQREQPRWIVWENVPGVLSSNGGRDFGSILGALEDLGYGLAYRVLDAQYFGVAQRRRRVFVVGYLGDWRPAAAVLFERHSMSGHPAPSRPARQEATVEAATGTGGGGGDGGARPDLAGPLTAGMHKGPRGTEAVESGHVVASTFNEDGTARTLTARYDSSPCVDRGPDVVGTLRAHHPGTAGVQSDTDHIVATYPINTQLGLRGPDVSNTSRDGLGLGDETDPAYTLQANHTHAVAFAQNTRDEVRLVNGDGQIVGALAAQPGMKQTSYVAIDAAHAFKVRGGCEGGGKGYLGSDEVAFTISTHQDQHIFSEPAAAAHEAFQPTADCLTAAYGTKWNGNASATNGSLFAQQQSTVRRLTPVECERLQGFPDNFTAIPWGKKEAADCPDGPRYKALGNSMAVPVMRWIGERINTVDDLISVL